MSNVTTQYKGCNHHHVMDKDQELVDVGTDEFVADKELLPLLKALNDIGLVTRTHCSGHTTGHAFVGILIDNVDIQIRRAYENVSLRKFTGHEILISWKKVKPVIKPCEYCHCYDKNYCGMCGQQLK